jgi:phage terminase large subunit-like protein
VTREAWDLSCPDWQDRLRDGRSLIPDLPLNQEMAARAVAAFNMLRLADVPGTPTMAEAGGEWFRDIVRALFGSLTPDRRTRRIRELFCLVPKKNSKTTDGALLMLVALLLNERPRAPFLMTAPVHDVADLAFAAAAGAISLDPVLSAKLHVREHLKTILHRETKAELQILTFDPSVLTGQKVAGALIDELHVVAKMAKAASAIRQLRGGMLPFGEAFLAFITTQSEEQPAGIFRAELLKARRIRDGKAQHAAMLPVLYEFPTDVQESGAWRNPALWGWVNPNAGLSVTVERLQGDYQTARDTGPEEEIAWLSQHLNIEVGVALKSDAWAGAEFWEDCADEALTLPELMRRSEVVTVGIDGGGLDDLLGVAVLGREKDTGVWLHWGRAWCHPVVLERRKAEAGRLQEFSRDGDLVIVKNVGEDVAAVAAVVEGLEEAGLLDKVGVDRAGIGAISKAIQDVGIKEDRIVGIPQGWWLQGSIKTVERQLAAHALMHGDRPMMAWAVGNAKVEQRGNAITITKQASGYAKIDPLMALFDAAAVLSLNPEARDQEQCFFV